MRINLPPFEDLSSRCRQISAAVAAVVLRYKIGEADARLLLALCVAQRIWQEGPVADQYRELGRKGWLLDWDGREVYPDWDGRAVVPVKPEAGR